MAEAVQFVHHILGKGTPQFTSQVGIIVILYDHVLFPLIVVELLNQLIHRNTESSISQCHIMLGYI